MTRIDDLARVLQDFNHGERFFAHLAPEVTLEFPFGPTLGLPAVLRGRQAVTDHLRRVQRSGLTLSDFRITPLAEEGWLAEYTGNYRGGGGTLLPSPLVSVVRHAGGRLTAIREYWDTKRLFDAGG